WSPSTVRAWPGQALRKHKLPLTPLPSTGTPSLLTNNGSTPKKGRVADPGLVGVHPGRGAIRMPPVSVCHHVSTTAQRFSPTTSWYQVQISGLMGSPTEPSTRKLLRLYWLT